MEAASNPVSSLPPAVQSDMDTQSSTEQFPTPTTTRFQLAFPRVFERWFAPFDDAIVALCQRRTTGAVLFFSTVFTFFTSIEVSLIAPPTLYALGYDRSAGLCSSVLLVLGVVSQVPKKFIFRPRPWMVSRALPVRRDKTSSFPSRAVVCAVVFSWLIVQSALLDGALSTPPHPVLLWLTILCVAALTAFARINVGAHYPSDTVLGFLLGCAVIHIGTYLESLWPPVCSSTNAYHSNNHISILPPSYYLSRLFTSRPFVAVSILSYLMTLISIQGFWVKCSYVYGLLMSSTAFRATYLCSASPPLLGRVSQIVHHGPLSQHFKALVPFSLLLFFGMLTRGKKGPFRVISFTVIYFGALIAILTWRLPSQTYTNGGR